MNDILYDIEGLRPFIERSLARFSWVRDSTSHARVDVNDVVMSVQMNDPGEVERYVRQCLMKALAERVINKAQIVRSVTPEGTRFEGHVVVLTPTELKGIIKQGIVAVLEDAVVWERQVEALMKGVLKDEKEEKKPEEGPNGP